MTTTAQVKRAVKPLLDRHPDLALVGRHLIVKPVGHVVRTIFIDRTGVADVFNPRWAAMHLFEVQSFIFFNWGCNLYKPQKGLWRWSDMDSISTLFSEIELLLPRLRAIYAIDGLVNELPDLWQSAGPREHPPLHYWPATKIMFDTALGDLGAARKICCERVAHWTEENYGRGDEDDKAKVRRLNELCRLLAADNRAGMAKLLHEWEAQTVRNLKIEHLWEPTPFPLETMPH
jgi:hypothetical protein